MNDHIYDSFFGQNITLFFFFFMKLGFKLSYGYLLRVNLWKLRLEFLLLIVFFLEFLEVFNLSKKFTCISSSVFSSKLQELSNGQQL